LALEIIFSGAPLGHEIRGVDLNRLSEAQFAEIEQAYDTYGVVVIRDQHLTPDAHIAYSKRFGGLDRYILDRYNLASHPEIFVVSNIIEDGKPVGLGDAGRYWHTDMWTEPRPPRGSIMYALEVPHDDDGRPLGDTYFTSTAAAYDALPESLRRDIEGRWAVYSGARLVDFQTKLKARELTDEEKIGMAERAARIKEIRHPLVRIHPRTGRRCIYFSEGAIDHVEGVSASESARILEDVRQHVLRPEFIYRHQWRVGDVVMWDNCSCLHKATADFDLPRRRRMHRTTLASTTAPVSAPAQ
jgi:taurine dioxygenase